MTAEEFYKDHFGHTSQHVSMDKIFVCMELYARYQKEVRDLSNTTQEIKQPDQYNGKTRSGGLSLDTGPRN